MEPKIVVSNRKAYYEYYIEDTFEAGIALAGTEVKSLRMGKASLQDAYARFIKDELWLFNAHISPYEQGNIFNLPPKRHRKLLMHRQELRRLLSKAQEKGYALIPLKIYFNERNKAKIALALAKGKKLYDKRDSLKKAEARREMDRGMREKN
jgi:SsrA-binding protein